jgi:predicted transcriptional regulator
VLARDRAVVVEQRFECVGQLERLGVAVEQSVEVDPGIRGDRSGHAVILSDRRSALRWYYGGTMAGMAMNLRLTDEQDRTLQELADAQHISKHEAVLRAIESQAERLRVSHGVEQFADYAIDRYERLLDRLSQ